MGRRALIGGAVVLAVSAGGGRALAQSLRGTDVLSELMTDLISACPGANGNITYVGGEDDAGEASMSGPFPTQHVAPMTRQLGSVGGSDPDPPSDLCTPNARQLLIGLDSVAILAKNAAHLDPSMCTDEIGGGPLVLTGVPSQFVPCVANAQCAGFGTTCDTVRQFCVPGGTLTGCTATQGCAPDGTYTFDNDNGPGADDWLDVVRQIYGGMNHTFNFLLMHDPNERNADGTAICFESASVMVTRRCVRNPARIDCANPVRGVLLASYGQIIRTPACTSPSPSIVCTDTTQCPLGQTCNLATNLCVPQECVKLRHAFRRDDLSLGTDVSPVSMQSGTTDAFVALAGLVPIAPFTALTNTGPTREIADFASTASPFCNAGTAAMNRGFSDGLDLDPYRRACSAGPAPDRFGLESVCQAAGTANNSDVSCYAAGVTPANYPQRERSSPQRRGVGAGGSVDTITAFQAEYVANATRPRCLGVVQPISIPQDVTGPPVWAVNRYPQGGSCTPGTRAFVNPLPANQILCPNGSIKAAGGTCSMPQNTANGRFDCVVDSPLPAGAGISDARIFNLAPVNNLGNMAALLDNYRNPNFPLTNLRRLARRYYGIHMVRPDNSQSQATITTPCMEGDDARQIRCLVKASPCSIGYAGPGAADAVAPFNNVALRIAGTQPSGTTIQNLVTGGTPVYPMVRKLWLNSFQNNLIGFAQPMLTDAELAVSNCMGLGSDTSLIDFYMTAYDFSLIPPGVPRLSLNGTGGGCPLP